MISHAITTKGFACTDCPNHCEIIEILDGKEVIGITGGRCGKWEGKIDVQASHAKVNSVPDLLEMGVFPTISGPIPSR
jgi:hypothetical protein